MLLFRKENTGFERARINGLSRFNKEADVSDPKFNAAAMISGARMLESEAVKLETFLAEDPTNSETRVRLLSYYTSHSEGNQQVRLKHIHWFLDNEPDFHYLLSPLMSFHSDELIGQYELLKDKWLKLVEKHPTDIKILRNAGTFFLFEEPELTEKLYLMAKDCDPDDLGIVKRLAHFYALRKSTELALHGYEESAAKAPNELDRFYSLTALVESAAEAGQYERAEEIVPELLALAKRYPNDWNFGNALYQANYALARIALSRNDIQTAVECFIKASETPGSPQLNSFGPKFDLANQLLKLNERKAVIQYVKNCAKFWKNVALCEKWLQQIENGQDTDFNKFDPENFRDNK